MTRDQFDQMLEAHGIVIVGDAAWRVAQLAFAAGEQAEREACAKVCDEQHDRARTPPGAARADACARAIRARGEKK